MNRKSRRKELSIKRRDQKRFWKSQQKISEHPCIMVTAEQINRILKAWGKNK